MIWWMLSSKNVFLNHTLEEYLISDGNEYIDEDLGKAKNTLGKKQLKSDPTILMAYVIAFSG